MQRTRIIHFASVAIFICIAILLAPHAQAETTGDIDQRVEKELRSLQPKAADLWDQANSIRTDDPKKAAELYEQIISMLPQFSDPKRRACAALIQAGSYEEGLTYCRQAVAQDRSSDNLVMLASSLAEPSDSHQPTSGDTEEAQQVINEAAKMAPADGYVQYYVCEISILSHADPNGQRACVDAIFDAIQKNPTYAGDETHEDAAISVASLTQYYLDEISTSTVSSTHDVILKGFSLSQTLDPKNYDIAEMPCLYALRTNDFDLYKTCVARLTELDPTNKDTLIFLFTLQLSNRQFTEAETTLEKARSAGMSDTAYQQAKNDLKNAEPWYYPYRWFSLIFFSTWLILFFMLFGLAYTLSQHTLKSVGAMLHSTNANPTARERLVRRLYRDIVWLISFYYYLSIPIVIAFFALLIGLIFTLFLDVGIIPYGIMIIIFLVGAKTIWTTLTNLFVHTKTADPGVRIDLETHQKLKNILDEIAQQVDTPTVENVFLDTGSQISVFERTVKTSILRHRKERFLLIGSGVLSGMSMSQFRAILAHEFAHFSNQDTAGGPLVLSAMRSHEQVISQLARQPIHHKFNPVWLFLKCYRLMYLRATLGASRLQETLADRWSVILYGAEAAIDGLRHVIEQGIRFDIELDLALQQAIEEERPLQNVYALLPSVTIDQAAFAEKLNNRLNQKTSALSSHPAPSERFEMMRLLGEKANNAEPLDQTPAWELFPEKEELEIKLTTLLKDQLLKRGIAFPTFPNS